MLVNKFAAEIQVTEVNALKVLHLSTFDITGGAARAAYRLHTGLQGIDINSWMLVQTKKGDDWRVLRPLKNIARKIGLFRPELDSLPLCFYPGRMRNGFSPAMVPDVVPSDIAVLLPDIVHMHWIGYGFLRIESLKKFNRPIVWTLHDMWAFTGGCHYDRDCGRYAQKCGACPQLGSKRKRDLSHRTWRRKLNAWRDLDLTVVAPSHWLAECAKKSSLFKNRRICIIPNGLNLDYFKTVAKDSARRLWNLPQDKKLILFGAINATGDRNKGFHLIQKALRSLDQNRLCDAMELVVFGAGEPQNPPDFGLKIRYVGWLHDDVSLAALYSASDVMVVPSLQEAFGQTASEAFACGCPVVSFRTTGLLDIVDHLENGYLARPFEPSDLAAGINWVLSDDNRHKELCIKAREKAVACFDIEKVAVQYADLYESIV